MSTSTLLLCLCVAPLMVKGSAIAKSWTVISTQEHINTTYQLEPFLLDWFDAGRFCELKGGRLATHITEQQNAAITAEIKKQGTYEFGAVIWIDGWCEDEDRNNCFWTKPWKNMNESFTYWHPGQPDNLEHCLSYKSFSAHEDWKWSDELCRHKTFFICEYTYKITTKIEQVIA